VPRGSRIAVVPLSYQLARPVRTRRYAVFGALTVFGTTRFTAGFAGGARLGAGAGFGLATGFGFGGVTVRRAAAGSATVDRSVGGAYAPGSIRGVVSSRCPADSYPASI